MHRSVMGDCGQDLDVLSAANRERLAEATRFEDERRVISCAPQGIDGSEKRMVVFIATSVGVNYRGWKFLT
jgi:hypothetical protein